MFKTLYAKIAAVLLVLFIFIGFFYVIQTLITTKLYHQEVDQRLNRSLAEYLVQESDYYRDGQADIQMLKDTFERLMHINPSIELYLLDKQGKILGYSAPPGIVSRTSVLLEPVQEFLKKEKAFPILGDDPRDPERKKIFSVAPIPAQGPVEAYLYIILGGEEYDSIANRLQKSYILKLSTWIAAAGLLVVFVLALLLFYLLTHRLRRLTAALDEFRQSDFQSSFRLAGKQRKDSGDEIDQLGKITAQMSLRLRDHVNTINRIDGLRKEMVANISHDLRTPLSSLQGYLETLLVKSRSLSTEEQRTYVETALQQSQKLGNLITELYDLAKLDSPDIKIHPEPFSLGELVQDIAQKYRLKAQERQVSLEIPNQRELPLVYAEIGLIDRALQNLMDNALSFSRPEGHIAMEILKDETSLTFKISDDGYGIRPEDIPFIFDRFYQGKGRRRDEDDDSTGLGLAITKRILDLHSSPLEVQSALDKRTVFMFPLPIYIPEV